MYTIKVPRSGWTQERITGVGDWRGDLACPRVVINQPIKVGERLSVELIKTQASIEIGDATIEEWQEESDAPHGGYWVEGAAVSHEDIQLVQ